MGYGSVSQQLLHRPEHNVSDNAVDTWYVVSNREIVRETQSNWSICCHLCRDRHRRRLHAHADESDRTCCDQTIGVGPVPIVSTHADDRRDATRRDRVIFDRD